MSEATSHILRVLSQDADTIVLPLGANSHAETSLTVALECLQALASCWVPKDISAVVTAAGEQPVDRSGDCIDHTAVA